ncbi:hypothetical protein ABK040_015791 [Willaertia magna]
MQELQTVVAHVYKVIIIGDSTTGKSSLMNRFCYNRYNASFAYTIGMEMGHRSLEVNSKKVKVTIFDTAGQERFRSITRNYYRGVDGALIVYDVTNGDSFAHIRGWLRDLNNYTDKEICKILIGNKSDQKELRKVSYDEGKQLAEDFGMLFIETSASEGNNVDEAFKSLIKSIIEEEKKHATYYHQSHMSGGIEILLNEEQEEKEKSSSGCKC